LRVLNIKIPVRVRRYFFAANTCFEKLRRSKHQNFSRPNWHFLASFRIASNTLTLLANGETSQALWKPRLEPFQAIPPTRCGKALLPGISIRSAAPGSWCGSYRTSPLFAMRTKTDVSPVSVPASIQVYIQLQCVRGLFRRFLTYEPKLIPT
jgi:hypothetical protein